MRYCAAKVNQHNEELSYKIYMTDCIAAIARTDKRWYDLLINSTETKSVDEMVNTVLTRCGVTITEEVKA